MQQLCTLTQREKGRNFFLQNITYTKLNFDQLKKKSEELCYYHLMNNALYEFGTSSTEKKHYIYIYSSCIYMLGPIILPFFISIHCPMPCRKSNLVAMASRSIMCSAPNRAVSACLAWPAQPACGWCTNVAPHYSIRCATHTRAPTVRSIILAR